MIFVFNRLIEENTESNQIYFFYEDVLRIGISKYHVYIELKNKQTHIGKIIENNFFLIHKLTSLYILFTFCKRAESSPKF